jgi:DNA modification methylase
MDNVFMACEIQHWPIDQLIPYANNPRTHSDQQIRQIEASIAEFGFTSPILVDTHHGILAGHGRLLAARQLGLEKVPVVVLDHLTETQKRAYILADNRLCELAGWDDELLKAELTALQKEDFDLSVPGFDDEELARLLARDVTPGLIDEEAIPEVPPKPISATGDLWILGPHRLLVGDATDTQNAIRLVGSDLADLIFTDPPYNVSYQGYTEDHLQIEGDRMNATEFQEFLLRSFRSYRMVVKPTASIYVFHSSSWQREFQNALEAAEFTIRCQLIWVKNTFAWGFSRYKYQHEPLFCGHVAGQSDRWYGNKSQSTVWEADKPTANRHHPTAKPVMLVERALVNSTKPGDIVVDLFGGSGSTLIGCERRGRKARLMEIDPRYADVIIRRWQEYTGQQAYLEGDGHGFETGAGNALRKSA